MPLHVRSIAVNAAVICFFALSVIGWLSSLSPFICCKRALIGAMLTYVIGGLATKAVNAVLINAMVQNQMHQKTQSSFTANRKVEFDDKLSGNNSK
jgi:hypothetical protein